MKQKTLSVFSISIICILCLLIGVLSTVIGCFCWVYNTPAIKEAFVKTYNNENSSFSVKETFGNVLSGTVEINIPLALLELDGEPFDYKLSEENKENGFTSIKKNSDGSATYTIKKKEYNKFIEEYRAEIKSSLDILTTDGTFPSIQKIEYTDNFDKITIIANKEKFESSLDSMSVMTCGLSSCAFQMFDVNSDRKCTVEVKDSTTGEVFQRTIYPDALQEQ